MSQQNQQQTPQNQLSLQHFIGTYFPAETPLTADDLNFIVLVNTYTRLASSEKTKKSANPVRYISQDAAKKTRLYLIAVIYSVTYNNTPFPEVEGEKKTSEVFELLVNLISQNQKLLTDFPHLDVFNEDTQLEDHPDAVKDDGGPNEEDLHPYYKDKTEFIPEETRKTLLGTPSPHTELENQKPTQSSMTDEEELEIYEERGSSR
tara:strand:+ start:17226 stop:17840 length:615 start_codon:yes stop_codon:yes gene_type:complete